MMKGPKGILRERVSVESIGRMILIRSIIQSFYEVGLCRHEVLREAATKIPKTK